MSPFLSEQFLRHHRRYPLGWLDTITHPLGYSWFVDGDVVMVSHSGAPEGSKNLLDSRIPEFTLKRDATLQAASLRLIGELYFVQHPHATGFVPILGDDERFHSE